MRKKIFILLFIFLPVLSLAGKIQDNGRIIRGHVTDMNGAALPGASVTRINSSRGVQTDQDGKYMIQVAGNEAFSLSYSFIGYETKTFRLNPGKDTVMNVSLSPKSFMTEEVFVNATRAGEKTPMSYSAISKEEISRNNSAQDIPYLLNYSPSLVVSSDAGSGVGYTNINIRGTDVKRINVTIDGVPVNDAESHGVWWVDLPDLASSADNIQVQRGVGTSTNGAGAFGATINFQTSNLNKEPYAELNSSYGSFNTSKTTLSFGTGLLKKKFAIDARLSKIWSDGYIDRAFSDMKSFYVSGTLYGETSILKLMIFSGVEHTYQAWMGVPGDSLKTHRTFNPYNYENETDNYWQDNYQLHYSKKINDELHVSVALHYTHGRGYYENYLHDTKYSTFNLPDAVFNGDTITSTDFIAQKWLRNDFYGATYALNYSKNKLTAVLGGGWNQYLGDHFGDIIWARIVTFNSDKYRWYQGTGNKKDFNTFLKINYSLTGNLNLYADLQFRKINYSIAGFDEDLKDVTQTHSYIFFNPKAGIVYNINGNQKIYASAGVSQREPDRSNFTDADPGRIPTPEKLFDYEAGYQYSRTGILLKGNLYYMNYIDQLILTGKINDVGATILTNVPKSYRAGVELEATIRINRALSWYGNMTLSRNIIPDFTDYTDNWDTYGQDQQVLKNKTISFSPSVIAGSIFDYTFLKAFHLNLNSKYVGKQYIDNTENRSRMLNSYLIHGLSLLYSMKSSIFRELNLQFAINNLLDRKYETNAWVYKYTEGGSLHIMDGYFPQAGRNFMVRADIKF
jgi:iron complex outermembrane recepter protein